MALALLLSFCAELPAANVSFDYSISRSGLPATVFHRKLSLKVSLGACSGCQAFADGVSTSARWLPATQECLLELPGTATALNVVGLNWTGGGTGNAIKATLYGDKAWAYSFTWDDSRASVLPNAKPIFDSYGYRAGMAINPALMGGGGYMTWADLDQLYNAGWGVFNHSWDHDSAAGIGITDANVNAQIDPTRAAIEARYPGYPDSYFVYPFNYINDWDAIRAKGFLGAEAQTGDNYVDVWPVATDPPASYTGYGASNADSFWLLRRHQAYRDTPVATWNSWLDNAAADARPRWVIAFSHQCIASPGFYDTSPSVLNAHLGYLYNAYGAGGDDSVWVAPSDEVLHYLYARQYTLVTRLSGPLSPSPTRTWAPSATITPTRTATATPTPLPCGQTVLRRVNAGGAAYTDGGGALWEADQAFAPGGWGYLGGTADSVSDPIAGSADDPLYQSERWGDPVEYRFTVPNGRYQLRFLFAEVYWNAAGARVFDVSLEGATAIGGLDLWAQAGRFQALQLTRTVTVSDGVLNVLAAASADAAKFSALEISVINDCASPTASATRTGSATASPTPSMTASASPTPSRTGSATATATATPSATCTASPTPSSSATFTATASAGATLSPTPLASPAASASATPSGVATANATASPSPSASATPTASATPSPGTSATPSATPSAGPSATRTATPSALPTAPATLSAAPTVSASPSPQASASPTLAASPSPTAAPSSAPSPAPMADGAAKVEAVVPLPNPNPQRLAFKLSAPAASLSLRAYSRAWVLQESLELPGPWAAGWNQAALPSGWATARPNGLCVLELRPSGARERDGRALTRALILR